MNKPEQAHTYNRCGYCKLPVLLLLVFAPFLIFSQASFQTCAKQFELKQYDSALICFNQLDSENRLSKENLYNRGLCHYELKNYPEAIHDFDACLTIDSSFKEAAWMLAVTLQQNGNWRKALTIYQMLNTRYNGYNGSKKRVFYYRLAVLICYNWYFMLAIMFMVIILVTIVAKTVIYKRG